MSQDTTAASPTQSSSKALPNMPRAGTAPTVYVVIPVFNRRETTLACVNKVLNQSYPNCTAIVADGGSTDGTPAAARERFPEAVVLTSNRELWWGGSARLGVDYALQCAAGSDYIMLMNDDTDFAADYVELLVSASEKQPAIYGGLVVDADDPSLIIDAAVSLDWPRFAFSGQRDCDFVDGVYLGSDVLPGRGTLFPAWAVQLAGSVDDKGFPHYLSDYEFSYRVKKEAGLALGIVEAATIKTKESPSSPPLPTTNNALRESIKRLKVRFSKRSKQNIPASWRFISRHAPRQLRAQLKRNLIVSTLRHITVPIRSWQPESPLLTACLTGSMAIIRGTYRTTRKLIGPYLISRADVEHLGLNYLALNQHQIIEKSPHAGYFAPGRPLRYLRERYPSAIPLYFRAANPFRKVARFVISRHRVSRRSQRLLKFIRDAKNFLAPRRIKTTIHRKAISLKTRVTASSSNLVNKNQTKAQDSARNLTAQARRLARVSASETAKKNASLTIAATSRVNRTTNLLASAWHTVNRHIVRRASWLKRVFLGPYLVTRADIDELGLDFLRLNQHRIIEPSIHAGFYSPARPMAYLRANYPASVALYQHSARIDIKIRRAIQVRSLGRTIINLLRMTKRAVFSLWQAPIIKSEDLYRNQLSIDQMMAAGAIEPIFKDRFYRESASSKSTPSLGVLQETMSRNVATMRKEVSEPRRRIRNQISLFRDETKLYQRQNPMRTLEELRPVAGH